MLIVFSGPLDRPDGLAAELRELGFEVVEYDKEGGGISHDIRRDDVLSAILHDIRRGRYCAVLRCGRRRPQTAPKVQSPVQSSFGLVGELLWNTVLGHVQLP